MTRLTTSTDSLTYERDLIEHTLTAQDRHPVMAAALGIRADRIEAELDRRDGLLAQQSHELDPLDSAFARLAPGHPGRRAA